MLSRKDIELKDDKEFYNVPVSFITIWLACLTAFLLLPGCVTDLNAFLFERISARRDSYFRGVVSYTCGETPRYPS